MKSKSMNEMISETFPTFKEAFNFAELNSTYENENILQVFKNLKGSYTVDEKGFVDPREALYCTFSSGEFFANDDTNPVKVQMWVNSLDSSELSKLSFRYFDTWEWDSLNEDKFAFMYYKSLE